MSETTDNTTAGTTVKPSEKFPNVPRILSVSELSKNLGLAPGTIANNVLSENAPEPDALVGERMVWLPAGYALVKIDDDTDVWQDWLRKRAEDKERRAAERAEKEAEQVKAFASKISGNAKSELLKALLATMSPEEIAAMTSADE